MSVNRINEDYDEKLVRLKGLHYRILISKKIGFDYSKFKIQRDNLFIYLLLELELYVDDLDIVMLLFYETLINELMGVL